MEQDSSPSFEELQQALKILSEKWTMSPNDFYRGRYKQQVWLRMLSENSGCQLGMRWPCEEVLYNWPHLLDDK